MSYWAWKMVHDWLFWLRRLKIVRSDEWCCCLKMRVIFSAPPSSWGVIISHIFWWALSGNGSVSSMCAQSRGKVSLIIFKTILLAQLCSVSITYHYYTTWHTHVHLYACKHTHTHTPGVYTVWDLLQTIPISLSKQGWPLATVCRLTCNLSTYVKTFTLHAFKKAF